MLQQKRTDVKKIGGLTKAVLLLLAICQQLSNLLFLLSNEKIIQITYKKAPQANHIILI